ncbi:MAG TPA: nucleotidyltransferase family protein [Candidatus Saccharimonadales bacterium]|nr:nucleotidyltransferase family protein [Candidatus Saccharimonadales bacterium]
MISAVILSAGESSRMGRPKALLPIDGQTFIERIVGALKKTSVGKVIVILGHNADEMRRRIEHLPVEILVNPDYKLGQLSSLQVAIRCVDTDCDGMLVHLVDHPYIDAKLVDRMIERFDDSGKLIVVPRYGTKRGHPVIFSRKLFEELLAAPMDQGAKAVVNTHRDDTLEIDTDDKGITVDIDTPELYRQHVKGE